MIIKITWNNTAGEIDSRTVDTVAEITPAIVEMISTADVEPGDTITVTEEETR